MESPTVPLPSSELPSPLGSPHRPLTSRLLPGGRRPDLLLARLFLRTLSSSDPRRALRAYARARCAGLALDRFALPALLGAAARAEEEGEAVGREAHGAAVKLGIDEDAFVQTALVRAYAASGRVRAASRVFDGMSHRDLVAWGVMLDCHCQSGCYREALLLFQEMKNSSVVPDQVILAAILSACGRTGNLIYGKSIHSYIVVASITIDAHLISSLISMYARCGSMDIAEKLYDTMCPKGLVASTAMVFGYAKLGRADIAWSIFDNIRDKDLVLWSAMISGYSGSDRPGDAIELFNKMLASGVQPDEITMLSVISACARLGALDQARGIHIFVDKNKFSNMLSVRNALIDMYSKCGSLASARAVFEGMAHRNAVTWTSMITGFAVHGDARSALLLFDQMKVLGVEPNGVTFLGLLSACSHAGMVEMGRRVFQSMSQEYKIEPKLEHYGCMVDLLGRAKLLHEAFVLVESMPFQPNVVVWGSLLGACRIHGDVELGETAAKKLLELDPNHEGAYALLSNIYAKAGMWEVVGELRRLMNCKGISREKGSSWIELDGHVHEFLVGDESHPESSEIYRMLDEFVWDFEPAGYTSETTGIG